jgi:transposase
LQFDRVQIPGPAFKSLSLHAPLIEIALVRSVRRSMALLREMPVLVPLAVDVAAMDAAGDGVIILMKVPRPIAKGSAVALRRNILKAKRPAPLPGEFTHHIAAHGDRRAKLTVEILERFGIHVDDEVNGVFLPGYASSPNPLGKVVHGNLHTDAYYDAVFHRLEKATSRADVEQALRKIAYELEHGIIPK